MYEHQIARFASSTAHPDLLPIENNGSLFEKPSSDAEYESSSQVLYGAQESYFENLNIQEQSWNMGSRFHQIEPILYTSCYQDDASLFRSEVFTAQEEKKETPNTEPHIVYNEEEDSSFLGHYRELEFTHEYNEMIRQDRSYLKESIPVLESFDESSNSQKVSFSESKSSSTALLEDCPDVSTTNYAAANAALASLHHRGSLQLWQFLIALLDDPNSQSLICWTGRTLEFKLNEPEEVARLWGLQKNRPAMNYDKLSRSLRYYYEKGIMQKVSGERYVYRFVCEPELLFALALPPEDSCGNIMCPVGREGAMNSTIASTPSCLLSSAFNKPTLKDLTPENRANTAALMKYKRGNLDARSATVGLQKHSRRMAFGLGTCNEESAATMNYNMQNSKTTIEYFPIVNQDQEASSQNIPYQLYQNTDISESLVYSEYQSLVNLEVSPNQFGSILNNSSSNSASGTYYVDPTQYFNSCDVAFNNSI